MLERDNLIGILLLALCAVVAGVLIYGMATGTRFRYTGPEWLTWVLAALFIGGSLYGLLASGRRGPNPLTGTRGRRWPDPRTGTRGWRWPWQRDQDDHR